MEIYLFSRPGVEHRAKELRRLTELAAEYLPGYKVNSDFAARIEAAIGVAIPQERQYETIPATSGKAVAISYGGDGTFLDCVRTVGDAGVPVLGINSGRLGFLANVPHEGIEQAFSDIAGGKFSVERRSMLQVSGDFPSPPAYPMAFNEFSLQRGGAGMVAVETYVDKEMVATYWGDGAMISTPSGSTAYSLSVGGPILAPGCECFVISPIAPHNLTMRPVVIPDICEVTMRVISRSAKPYATLDNLTFDVEDGAVFSMSKSKIFTFLVRLQNISFYDTLRNKMMWGIDRRSELK